MCKRDRHETSHTHVHRSWLPLLVGLVRKPYFIAQTVQYRDCMPAVSLLNQLNEGTGQCCTCWKLFMVDVYTLWRKDARAATLWIEVYPAWRPELRLFGWRAQIAHGVMVDTSAAGCSAFGGVPWQTRVQHGKKCPHEVSPPKRSGLNDILRPQSGPEVREVLEDQPAT